VTRAADERVPLLVWVVLGGVLVVVFEALLYLTAVMLFPHIDTPDCASTDTFCFPDGRPGVIGERLWWPWATSEPLRSSSRRWCCS
jgi:hypothetical protein